MLNYELVVIIKDNLIEKVDIKLNLIYVIVNILDVNDNVLVFIFNFK